MSNEQMTMDLVNQQHKPTMEAKGFPCSAFANDNYPEILDVGPLGIKWRGENVPLPESMYKNDYTVQFGFSCAECGGSGINQDPVIHIDNCKRK